MYLQRKDPLVNNVVEVLEIQAMTSDTNQENNLGAPQSRDEVLVVQIAEVNGDVASCFVRVYESYRAGADFQPKYVLQIREAGVQHIAIKRTQAFLKIAVEIVGVAEGSPSVTLGAVLVQ